MAESNRGVAVVLVDAAVQRAVPWRAAWRVASSRPSRRSSDGRRARRLQPLEGRIDAVVVVPGSKSIANRALVCAALAAGTSELTNVPDGDDTTAMIDGLTALGAGVDVVRGTGRDRRRAPAIRTRSAPADVHAALAGTTSRFLTALAALGRASGDDRRSPGAAAAGVRPAPRRARAARRHRDARRRMGAPAGDRARARRRGSAVSIAGDVSSQYITALMLIGPCLPGGLATRAHEPAGVAAVRRDDGSGDGGVRRARHRRHRGRRAGRRRAIPAVRIGDRAGRLVGELPDGGRRRARWPGRDPWPRRAVAPGRCPVRRPARRDGLPDERLADRTVVSRGDGAALRGIDVDMSDISDLVPTLAAVALFAETPTRITGSGSSAARRAIGSATWRGELRALGGAIDENDDGLVVHPSASRLARRRGWRPTTTTGWRWRSA